MDMAEKSAYNEIKRKVKSSKRGTLFFPDLFAHTALSDAVRSALVRLCKGRDIIRVAQGIYCYPKIDEKCESVFIHSPFFCCEKAGDCNQGRNGCNSFP